MNTDCDKPIKSGVGRGHEKPTIPDVMPLVDAYYCKNPTGGSLHIVLDDGNVDDSHVVFCLKRAEENNDLDGVRIAKLLLRMSKTQRLKLGAS